ncbi:hypothetical protein C5167_021305 [Papaver somniferum]|uniref:Uncharacterized protein n=1 Tax=Papaver somniferum TaxID=3469 RepID=A0A4Y7IZF2_PAPSO|nr:hypothetical protein C5167_021305 [Papaver somniferum]
MRLALIVSDYMRRSVVKADDVSADKPSMTVHEEKKCSNINFSWLALSESSFLSMKFSRYAKCPSALFVDGLPKDRNIRLRIKSDVLWI